MTIAIHDDADGQIPLARLAIVLADVQLKDQHTRIASQFDPWRGDLSFEEFEAVINQELAEGAWARDDDVQTWALIDRQHPSVLLSGCESYRRKAFVKPKDSTDVEEIWCYGIASVIAPVEHRGKGYAKHMLQLLHYVFASPDDLPPFPAAWGEPPALKAHQRNFVPFAKASMLFSDIGPDYYAKCMIGLDRPGWQVRKGNQASLLWDLKDAGDMGEWEVVRFADISAIASDLGRAAKDTLAQSDTGDAAVLAQDPASPGILEFIHHRSTLGPQPAWRLPLDDEPAGLRKGDAVVLFTRRNFVIAEHLLVTYIHNLDPSDVRSLLRALDAVCCGTGIKKGWAWGLKDSRLIEVWSEDDRAVEVGLRAGHAEHLLGLAWYGSGEVEVRDGQMWNWL